MPTTLSHTSARTATLLIVDHDPQVRRSLKRTFEDEGHRVVAVADAPTALRKLHQERCDLIMLDSELPNVSGLALCRLLRAQVATKRLPIIIISAHADEEHKVGAFAAGADDFMVKNTPPRELISRVGAHLEASLRERALEGSNRELAFLADLGRGLLRSLEPYQVVRRVAGAVYEAVNATLSAVVLMTNASRSSATCVFDREGSAEDASLINADRLQVWLASAPSATTRSEERSRFFLRDESHRLEYVAPLRFDNRTLGALIVAFDRADECGETETRLLDAAAHQASLAAHISTLYDTARSSSVELAKEVERRTAETEAQRRFTEAIIDSLPVSLYAVDRDYSIVAWNRNRELGGQGLPRGRVLGRNVFEVLNKQPRELLAREFARAFKTGQIERIEHETTSTDGLTKHWLISKIPMQDESGAVSHVIAVGEDITARVEANRAVARAEKLSAVGRLAAGVVHEINNPLATIAACAEALESRVSEGTFGESSEVDNLREYLQLIRSEAFRCKSITNGLLDFSRARAGEHELVDIAETIESAARLLQHQRRGHDIEIKVETESNLAPVSGDRGQLQQAVITLAENAIDAMPEGGLLVLRARPGEGTPSVIIEVSDSGVGIPYENLAKIFDPFYTTKEIGRGTGLGLAVCYGIVTEHGGRISVESNVGHGTTFTIMLHAAATA